MGNCAASPTRTGNWLISTSSTHWLYAPTRATTGPFQHNNKKQPLPASSVARPHQKLAATAAASRWRALSAGGQPRHTLLAGGEWGSGPHQINQQHQQKKKSTAAKSLSNVVFCGGGRRVSNILRPSAAPVPSPAASRTDKVPFTILHTLAFVSLHQQGGVNIPQFSLIISANSRRKVAAHICMLICVLVCCFFCSGIPLSLRDGRGGECPRNGGRPC